MHGQSYGHCSSSSGGQSARLCSGAVIKSRHSVCTGIKKFRRALSKRAHCLNVRTLSKALWCEMKKRGARVANRRGKKTKTGGGHTMHSFFGLPPKFTLTDEQKAIIHGEHMATTSPVVVQAGAGTGKTSTIRGIVSHHRNLNVLCVAFNRDIVDSAAVEFKHLQNAAAMTFHEFYSTWLAGNSVGKTTNVKWKAQLKECTFASDDEFEKIYTLLTSFCDYEGGLCDFLVADRQMDPVHVELCGGETTEEQRERAEAQNKRIHKLLVANESRREAVKTIWDDITTGKLTAGSQLPQEASAKLFQHVMNNAADSKYLMPADCPGLDKFDVLCVDEAQDSNWKYDLVTRYFIEANKLTLLFGDKYQQINSWNGAVNAMAKVENEYQGRVTSLSLTTSFRFGPEVANVANVLIRRYNRHVGGPPSWLRGSASRATTVGFWSEHELHRIVADPLSSGSNVVVMCWKKISGLLVAGRCVEDGIPFSLSRNMKKHLAKLEDGSDRRITLEMLQRIKAAGATGGGGPNDLKIRGIHTSKGKEFDMVLVHADCYESLSHGRKKQAHEDAPWICFTAVTRVKHALWLPSIMSGIEREAGAPASAGEVAQDERLAKIPEKDTMEEEDTVEFVGEVTQDARLAKSLEEAKKGGRFVDLA